MGTRLATATRSGSLRKRKIAQERNVPDSLPRTLGRSSGQSFPDLSDGDAAAQVAPLITNIAVFHVGGLRRKMK